MGRKNMWAYFHTFKIHHYWWPFLGEYGSTFRLIHILGACTVLLIWRRSSCFTFDQKRVDIRFNEAECYKIDAENRKLYCRSNENNNLNGKKEFVVDYDYLVIAVGAQVNTFNTPGVVENCHFLKVIHFNSCIITKG